jgi:nucleoside-diphosphate-sugar epimerase
VLDACREAGVRRFVHVGTEAATMAGQPLVRIDETAPLRPDSKADYCATKAMAEEAVRAANGDRLQTVVVRPRLVWGTGDTTILPGVVDAVRTGRFRWIAGGHHKTSTTHVDNVVQGLVLGAERGRPGDAYFVTDGEPVVFRDFITELADTQDVEIPDKGVPKALAGVVTAGSEAVFRGLRLKGTPPLTRLAYWLSALECTIDISKARDELGYAPVRTIEDGMAELRAAGAG